MAHVSVDHAVFALPDFDPNDYANAVLAGEPYPPQPGKNKPLKATGLAPASEDVSVAISKLTFSLDDVEKQLKSVVSLHDVPSRTVAKIAPSHSGRSALAMMEEWIYPRSRRIWIWVRYLDVVLSRDCPKLPAPGVSVYAPTLEGKTGRIWDFIAHCIRTQLAPLWF